MSGGTPTVLGAALFGHCPRCGKGKLFNGYLSVAPGCSACGLDFRDFDAGDGPAVFVILIAGAVIAGGALILEFNVHPPYWVQVVIWLPATLLLTIVLLRLIKGLLLVLQFRHQAGEGRLSE